MFLMFKDFVTSPLQYPLTSLHSFMSLPKMETIALEYQHDEEDDYELEVGFLCKRKNVNKMSLSNTNIDEQQQQHEQEQEQEQEVNEEIGRKVGEDEKEYYDMDKDKMLAINKMDHPWEQQDYELEQGLIATKNNPTLSITINRSNGEQKQEHEQENEDEQEEEVKDFSEENGIKIDEDDNKKEKEYSVYYDTDKGIWKCRICPWDNLGRTCLTRHYQRPKSHPHILVNVKTVYETKGDGKSPVPENTDITRHNQTNGNGTYSIISNQNGEHQKQDNFIDSSLQPGEISVDKSSPSYINNKTENTEIEEIKDGDGEIIEYDVETVLKKQDTHDLFCPNCNSCITKRVILRKRKRRIPVPGEDSKRNKAETPFPSHVNGVLDGSSDAQARNGVDRSLEDVQPPTSNEYDHQRDPDVFRCLSCFSIFMPTGNGFKLFRMFGNKSNKENIERTQKEVPVKKNWFSKFFGSDKMEDNVGDLNESRAVQSSDMENNAAGISIPSSNLNSSRQDTNSDTTNGTTNLDNRQLPSALPSAGRDVNEPFSIQGPGTLEQRIDKESENVIKGSNGRVIADSPLADTHEQLLTSYHTESNDENEYPGMFVVKPPFNHAEAEENSISSLQHDGLKLVIPPNVGSLIIDNSQMNQELDVTVQMNNPGLDEKGTTNLSFSTPASVPVQSNYQIDDLGLWTNLGVNGKEQKMDKDIIVPEVLQQHTIQNNVEIRLKEPLKVDKDVLTDNQVQLLADLKNIERIQGKDTIITIESNQPDASAYQRSPPDTLGATGTPALQNVESGSQVVGQRATTTETGGRSLDIVKSIVYGGLMESITSLSVVSSAAGADAATLNVLALGLANIFGGLFIICHDLWDLKNERTRKSEDRYKQLLGLRRTDFPLHMTVSLLSYLVFGFLPPIVYGFSFRESNDKNFKLLMVAAASIMSIIILAAGKAYVQSPRKSYFKTILYYVMLGFMVSGASYLFGELIMMLLEKIDIFDSGSAVNLSIHGASSNPALSTY